MANPPPASTGPSPLNDLTIVDMPIQHPPPRKTVWKRWFGSERTGRRTSNGKWTSRVRSLWPLWINQRDWILTIAAAVYLALCAYTAYVASSFAERRNPNSHLPAEERYIIPDLLMEATTNFYSSSHWMQQHIADTFVQLSVAFIVIRCITLGRKSFTVLRRAAYLLGSLYLFRSPVIVLTLLPQPNRECEVGYKDNIGLDAIYLMGQTRQSCGDVFYSGHTLLFTLSPLFWYYYTVYRHPNRPFYKSLSSSLSIVVSVLAALVSIFGALLLIITQRHYTIDVLFGFILAVGSFVMYHWLVSISELKRTPIGRFVGYIDSAVFWEDWENGVYQKRTVNKNKVARDSSLEMRVVDDVDCGCAYANGDDHSRGIGKSRDVPAPMTANHHLGDQENQHAIDVEPETV
ncbi:hypothetical protein HDU85_004078 [Gaertneriomyces sp. JEL0708]|nr:hypothetical protein HDU85_004078 [Gaertneriomyces sp. JEL0708]